MIRGVLRRIKHVRSVVEREIGQHVAEVRVKRVRVVEELVRVIIGGPCQ